MKDAAELKNHVYDIVGALHSVHDELGPGIKAFHPLYKGRPMDAEYRIDFLCQNRQMGAGELARAPKASCFE